MVRRDVVIVAVIGSIGLICGAIFAECGVCEMGSVKTEKASSAAAAVNINNTICPVSGEPVDLMNPITLEYNGKIYNFCCSACIAPFKADPEKYIAKMAAQEAKKN